MATLLGNSRVSAHPQLTPRRGSQRRSETTIFTAESATNGFLRYRFEPVVEELAELHDQAIIEAEFFQSLLFLSQAYGFGFDVTAMENTSVYPHNVFLAFSQAEAALQATDPNASLAIIEDDDTLRSTLAVYKVYETGFTSYYIPLEPLYQTLKGKSRLSASALLCSLVSYLHTLAGVAFFSDESSFVYYQCDMMAESMREDDEENQLAEFETLLTDTRLGGSILQRYIGWNQRHLDAFETRHQSFRPTDEWEEALHRISGSFLSLYRQYPDRTYYRSYERGLAHSDDDYSIDPDQRIGFLWQWGDWVHDNILESLDCDFNGGGYVEEPLAYHLFDRPCAEPPLCLAFEEVFYTSLDALADLLKNLADEQHNRQLREVVSANAGTAGLSTGEQ